MIVNKKVFEEYKNKVDQLGKITEMGYEIRDDEDFFAYSSLWMKDEKGNTLTIPLPLLARDKDNPLEDLRDGDIEELVRIIFVRTFEDWETVWIHDKSVEVYRSWNKARRLLPCKKTGLMNWDQCFTRPYTVDPVYHI